MDLTEAHIIGIFIRTFFYGIYLLTVAHCVRWIFFEDEGWRLRSKIDGFMLSATVLVFIFSTTSLAIWLLLTLASVRGMPSSYLYMIVTATADHLLTLMIDATLIFRCWLVSHKSWPIISFPLVLWFANIGFFAFYTYRITSNIMYTSILREFFSCNIAINVYATSAIVYQILQVARRPDGSGSDLYQIGRIILECGLPYFFTSTFYLVVVVSQTEYYLFPTACSLNSTMNAVTFNLLLIRVGLYRTDGKRNDLEPKSISNIQFGVPTCNRSEDHAVDCSGKPERTQGTVSGNLP